MLTLNLIYKHKNDIPYVITYFPDGEVHIILDEINRKEEVNVICRITNAEELFILMQVGDILNRQEVKWNLTIYYLMSMRMDRIMSFNESFSLKVVADIINNLHPYTVKVAHPHSARTLEMINNCSLIVEYHPNDRDFMGKQLCFPDEGALERYSDNYSVYKDALIGEKVRNPTTGKIESIIIKNPEDYKGIPIMVVDDLCDAGGTFLGIASAIRSIDKDAKLEISVIHMVNWQGIMNLSKAYDKVFFTNTFRDWNTLHTLPDNCIVCPVIKQ